MRCSINNQSSSSVNNIQCEIATVNKIPDWPHIKSATGNTLSIDEIFNRHTNISKQNHTKFTKSKNYSMSITKINIPY